MERLYDDGNGSFVQLSVFDKTAGGWRPSVAIVEREQYQPTRTALVQAMGQARPPRSPKGATP